LYKIFLYLLASVEYELYRDNCILNLTSDSHKSKG